MNHLNYIVEQLSRAHPFLSFVSGESDEGEKWAAVMLGDQTLVHLVWSPEHGVGIAELVELDPEDPWKAVIEYFHGVIWKMVEEFYETTDVEEA